MQGKKIYNSRILKTYIRFLENKYRNLNIRDVLEYAGVESHQVEDPGHWFTQEQVDSFDEAVRRLTGNEDIAREAGRYSTSPEAIGIIGQYLLGFSGPMLGYELIGKLAAKFSKSSKYESKKIGPNCAEITVTPYEGATEKAYQCSNRMGFFEAVGMYFGHKMPTVEHPECMFQGGKVCRYIITWASVQSDKWKMIRNYSYALLLIVLVVGSIIHHGFFWPVAPYFSSIALLLALIVGKLERSEVEKASVHLRGSTEQLMEQVSKNYNNVLVINEIGLALSKQLPTNDILDNVVNILTKRLDYERGMVLLASGDKKYLYFKAGYGYTVEQVEKLRKAHFHLDKPDSKGVFIRCFKEQKPFLIDDVKNEIAFSSTRSIEFAKSLESKSFICCPIVYEGESIGIIAVDNYRSRRLLLESDINLMMGIAPEIGISIHNYLLIEGRKRQFHSILATLAASIDARDFLTAGHSEKVTQYALGICKEMGLTIDDRETIRVSALLHDYGKIGIDDKILKKPGKLTPDEFREIQTHAQKTRDILNQINFEGIYKNVPEIAGCHHEKVDGSGYPYGLIGDEIPLGSRIIAVADFFEAVTAQRHYRAPMPISKAVSMLEELRDKHYDGKVIDAFLRYYYSSKSKMDNDEEAEGISVNISEVLIKTG